MPATWINVADAERAAAEVLEPGPLGYFAGGAGDEETLAENLAAWRRWRLVPRVLTGVEEPSLACEVLGKPAATPVVVAPVAYQRLAHADGEPAMARAAADAGAVHCHSTFATASPSEVAAAAPDGRRWFQLYPFRDEAVTRAMVAEAIGAGFEAIVLTVDAPPGGNRERDLRSGFTIPAETAVPSANAALGAGVEFTVADSFSLVDAEFDWDDLAGLVAEAGVPVLVKGVLDAGDAVRAVEHGAAAVVVSNHGGRQLDRSPASAEVLAEIVDAVAGRAPVLVDGGIRRGVDVALALALGAQAVLVGRAPLWGLAAAGEAGARRVLELFGDELALAIALCGCASPAELTRAHARRGPSPSVYSAQ